MKEVYLKLDIILEEAIKNKASDVHLTVGVPPILRVNGKLLHLGKDILESDETLIYARFLLGDIFYKKFLEVREYDFSYNFRERFNFRVNLFFQRNNCGIVMRLIPNKIPSFDTLKLPDIFRIISAKRRGLILVTGTTGSGKTSTLSAMINHMSKTRNEHIITIEDPIEYIFNHGTGIINQRQIGTDTKTYSSAIRNALREDIDVIMVGEMRDLETITAAITAAETGHLVLSTLHTVGAVKTIDRIIDVFPPEQQNQIRTQLGSVLEAVISQQLIINRNNTGRELAYEVMVVNNAISNLIRGNKLSQIQNIIQTSSKEGMNSMDQSLINLYRSGKIDKQNLMKFCINENEVKLLIDRTY